MNERDSTQGASHAAREAAKCVLHVHSLSGVAVSAQKKACYPFRSKSPRDSVDGWHGRDYCDDWIDGFRATISRH